MSLRQARFEPLKLEEGFLLKDCGQGAREVDRATGENHQKKTPGTQYSMLHQARRKSTAVTVRMWDVGFRKHKW